MQFFYAAAQAYAKNFAPANGNQGMGELVALAQRVVLGPRIEVRKNASASVVVESDHEREGPDQHAGNQEEHAGIDAAQKQDAHGDDRNHHEGTHIGFRQQQTAHGAYRGSHGPDRFHKIFLEFDLAHHVACRVQHGGKLGQFGRLKVGYTQRNPTFSAIDAFADKRQQNGQQ